ncbi:phospholipid scramblase-related protein [Xanthomonas translucens]|uniref:phospholipid scramblase-related protein n=1 Tax=Xanthomonas campestris pv. translucens TaxID=343 RepID=UPI00064256CA|nr:phospholipid scramblase-related protein [Xanthomonas translucens]AKK68646.1 RNAase [Xanthomonas translucens pv. undulosa]MCT8269416.1 phospholipid scramblase family protein [Xanthomonas translucens pv. undulosa]QEN94536.1 RNAase [Xanthomonas translucens pv. undulosa]QEO27378.1 RNAase [Xanthomonas translucens pv. undulosa]QSQ42883.1 RNAase [Xanthomonas translucens pv. translucens]
MHPVLQQNLFFVKEQVGMFKAANNYDVFDPQSNQQVLQCREPNLGIFTKIFRFSDYKRMTPFQVEVRTPNGQKVLTVKRGFSLFLSKVEVLDEHDRLVGSFSQKFFSIGGKFDVLDAREKLVCTLRGKWTSWDFRFVQGERELARVSKKWAGLGKELFTSADNYMLAIDNALPAEDDVRILIMAAVLCIDMVLKE